MEDHLMQGHALTDCAAARGQSWTGDARSHTAERNSPGAEPRSPAGGRAMSSCRGAACVLATWVQHLRSWKLLGKGGFEFSSVASEPCHKPSTYVGPMNKETHGQVREDPEQPLHEGTDDPGRQRCVEQHEVCGSLARTRRRGVTRGQGITSGDGANPAPSAGPRADVQTSNPDNVQAHCTKRLQALASSPDNDNGLDCLGGPCLSAEILESRTRSCSGLIDAESLRETEKRFALTAEAETESRFVLLLISSPPAHVNIPSPAFE